MNYIFAARSAKINELQFFVLESIGNSSPVLSQRFPAIRLFSGCTQGAAWGKRSSADLNEVGNGKKHTDWYWDWKQWPGYVTMI